MKVIIDIPEESVEWVNDYFDFIKVFNGEKIGIIIDAIKNGTPLPKGYGRLIDADELRKKWIFGKSEKKEIDDAPTIIEADKSESEV